MVSGMEECARQKSKGREREKELQPLIVYPSNCIVQKVPPSTHTDIQEELDDATFRMIASIHHDYYENKTPYSEKDEYDGDEEKLDLHVLHGRLPTLC